MPIFDKYTYLTLSDLEESVMEIACWKCNVKVLSTFYCGSAVQYVETENICTEENGL